MRKLHFILFIFILIPNINKAENADNKAKATDSAKIRSVDTAFVTKMRTLEKGKNFENRAMFGDFIEVNVAGISYLIDSIAGGKKDSIILFLNNIPMDDIHARTIAVDTRENTGTIVFRLSRKSKSLAKLEPYFVSFVSSIQPTLSVGVINKAPAKSTVSFTLYYLDKTFVFATFGIMILIVVLIYFFSRKFKFFRLKNDEKLPYSLAHIQLAFWTILVSFSYVYLWIVNGEIPEIPSSILVLMGISVGTKGIAGYIDYNFDLKNSTRNYKEREGFLKDILSDENGTINIQRVQMVIWTTVLGFIYIQTFVVNLTIRDFDTNILTLMGISSGVYALLKPIESSGAAAQKAHKSKIPDNDNKPPKKEKKDDK